jgi:carbamoyl-phosphate synthase large subunit
MKNLLISGLGGSLFPYLHNKLRTNYNLFYIDADSELAKLYPKLNFFRAPLVSSHTYIPFLKKLIEENAIDVYIPLIDEELISTKSDLEGVNDVIVLAPTAEFCSLSLNKFKLMQVLKVLQISTIESYIGSDFSGSFDKPIFVKPISGRGSRGIRKIASVEQLQAYYILEGYEPEEILIQEYIEGVEYTIGATVNNLNDLLSVSIKKIIRKKGITQIAVMEDNPLLFAVVKDVVSKLKPCGPINIQLYLTDENTVKIFEINPRFSTTTIMSYQRDVDEIGLYLEYYNNSYKFKPIVPAPGIVLHRRWENVFYEG